MKTWHIAAASLISCIGIVGIWQPWHPRAEVARKPAKAAALREESESAAEPPRRSRPFVAPASPPPRLDEAPAGDEPRAGEPAPAKQEVFEAHEMFARVQSTFGGEKTDRAWSPRAEQGLREKVNGLLPQGGTVSSAECRSSMCRLVVKFKSEDERRDFFQSAFFRYETHVWDGALTTSALDEGNPNELGIVAFLMRPDAAPSL